MSGQGLTIAVPGDRRGEGYQKVACAPRGK
jgi:hypothetical protein